MSNLEKFKNSGAMEGIDSSLLKDYTEDVVSAIRPQDLVMPSLKLAQNNCTAQVDGLCGDGDFYSFDTEVNYGTSIGCLVVTTDNQITKRFHPDDPQGKIAFLGNLEYSPNWKTKYKDQEEIVHEGVKGVTRITESMLLYLVMPKDLKKVFTLTINGGSLSTGRKIRSRQLELLGAGVPPFLEKIKVHSGIQTNKNGNSYKQILVSMHGFLEDKEKITEFTDTVKKVISYKKMSKAFLSEADNSAMADRSTVTSNTVVTKSTTGHATLNEGVTTQVSQPAVVVKKSVAVKKPAKLKVVKQEVKADLGGQLPPTDEPTVVDASSWDFN